MKRMKALGVVEWHLTVAKLFITCYQLGCPRPFISSFQGCTRTRQGTRSLYEGLSFVHDGFFP